jgi:hypothetical protein
LAQTGKLKDVAAAEREPLTITSIGMQQWASILVAIGIGGFSD